MADRVDRIVNLIDDAFQSSPESGNTSVGDSVLCARCQLHEPDNGDLCGGCRAFLLEDSDQDPRRPVPTTQPIRSPIAITVDTTRFEAAIEAALRQALNRHIDRSFRDITVT